MKNPISDWLRGKEQSLDELVNSIPVLTNSKDNNVVDAFVLPLRPVNRTLNVGYVVNDQYKEVPISFRYRYNGREHYFSLSEDHERVNPAKGSVVFPLDVYEQAWTLPPELATENVRQVHPLIVKDKGRVIAIFIHDANYHYPLEMLIAEPDFPPNHPDIGGRTEINDAVRPVLEARRSHLFNVSPHEIKGDVDWRNPPSIVTYLDQYIIGQQHAKKAIAVAFSNYMVRRDIDDEELPKDNLLLIGGTGTGKTQSMRVLSTKAGVPFYKMQMTGKSSAGYVGEPFLNLFQEIARRSRSKAPYAIVFLDELDKLVDSSSGTIKREVQGELIPILEDGQVAGISTRNILFVAAGAFGRNIYEKSLRDIIAKRTGANPQSPDVLMNVQQSDIVEYGLMGELVGRLPVIGVLNDLSVDDKVRILTESKGSVLNNYLRMLQYKKYRVEVNPDFIRFVAEHSPAETGARGLQSVCNEVLREVFYNPAAFAKDGVIHLDANLAKRTMQLYRNTGNQQI